jgi:hypothetical protein
MAPFTPGPQQEAADRPADPPRRRAADRQPPVPPSAGRPGEPPLVERRRAPRRPLAPSGEAGTLPPRAVPPLPAEPRPVREASRPAVPPVPPAPAPARPVAERPVPERPAPWTTGSQPPVAPPYGDWTKPRSGASTGEDRAVPERSAAPEERRPSGEQQEGRSSRAAELFPRLQASAPPEDDAPRERGPRSVDDLLAATPTSAGRAASRAQREAAEAERRRAREAARPDAGASRRSPRRLGTGLVAVAVVALGVLGVYSFASPDTREAAAAATAGRSTAPSAVPAPDLSDLPPLNTGAISASPAPTTAAAPVAKQPVTVLNETQVTGLAAKVAGVLKSGGWATAGTGAYPGKDVAVSTVYFTQGDEQQRLAAVALVDQYPQLHGPVPRFFDVPGQPSPGVVVVTTGDWKP